MRAALQLRRHLALRLTAAVALGLALVISLIGVHVMQSEEADLQDAVTAETLLLTRSVQIGVEHALRDGQVDDIDRTLIELSRVDPQIKISVLDARGDVVAGSPRDAHPANVAPDGRVHFVRSNAGPFAAMHVVPAQPMVGYSGLLVSRTLHSMTEDLAHTRLQVVVTALASIAASTLLLLVLFQRSVEKPLARMTHAMRRFRDVGQPELEAPFSDDEVGDALREFSLLAHELQQARQRLEHENEERAALEHHLVQLDKLATVGQLSARVAHEIGSPLQVLEGRLSVLARELSGHPANARLVEIALEQTRRITRVVSQLLSVAKPTPSGKLSCDAGRTASTIAEFLELEAKRRGVTLEVDIDAGGTPAAVEADHFAQIVLNLLRNALEATPRGGRVRLAIDVQDTPSAKQLRIRVIDTGNGMTQADRERVFEPFFTTRLDSGGTGLGLPIVRSLVHRYGGEISVQSAPAEGTSFEIVLPFDRDAALAPHDPGEQHV